MTDFNVVQEFKNKFPTSRVGTKKFEKFNQKLILYLILVMIVN